MQKSIFYKYFRSTAAVVAASILVLGSLFMIFASDYFKEDKRETMQQQITITSSLLLANSEYDGGTKTGWWSTLPPSPRGFETLSMLNDSAVFFTNSSGVIQIWCEDGALSQPVYTVSPQVLRSIDQDGSYFAAGRLEGPVRRILLHLRRSDPDGRAPTSAISSSPSPAASSPPSSPR